MKRALISVSDKTGLATFARGLAELGIEILSTGGTKAYLESEGITVTSVESVTGCREILDGRVKTLHPKIHGGLLAKRQDPVHLETVKTEGIVPIDLVCVNLYPFQATINQPDVLLETAIEQIDIGGPALLRSGAKNYQDVTVVVDSEDYQGVLQEIMANNATSLTTRLRLATKVFQVMSAYDAVIATYLAQQTGDAFPAQLSLAYHLQQPLRYGENSQQSAAFYANAEPPEGSLPTATQLQGKQLSYNNLKDADAAVHILRGFSTPTAVVVKHMNPCAVGQGKTIEQAFNEAYLGDPTSIFGGIVCLNRPVTAALAQTLKTIFLEIVIAPAFDEAAVDILRQKANVRLLVLPNVADPSQTFDYQSIEGGLLVQTSDVGVDDPSTWQVVTIAQPSKDELRAAQLAWQVVKFVKSNAIVLANPTRTVGIGAGQMNRIGSVKIALEQAHEAGQLAGAVLASDGFFPLDDCVRYAASQGIRCIIQPGGSIKDEASIQAANELGVSMLFTGKRHFKH